MSDIESLISRWNGAAVLTRFDHQAEAWMFIALHDLTMGPASGGTRMKVYDTPAAGLRDAMRLAEGMTWKWASIALPHGGGKAVIKDCASSDSHFFDVNGLEISDAFSSIASSIRKLRLTQ